MGFRIRVQYVGWFRSWKPYGRVDEPGYHSYGWFHVLMDGEVELVLDIKKDVGFDYLLLPVSDSRCAYRARFHLDKLDNKKRLLPFLPRSGCMG